MQAQLAELRDEVALAHAQLEQKNSDLRAERARMAELEAQKFELQRDLDDAARRAQSVSGHRFLSPVLCISPS